MQAFALIAHLLTGGFDADMACTDSPATCRTAEVPVRVLYAVAWVESRWHPLATRGRHVGAWQQRSDTASVHPLALYLPPVAELEARRHLAALLARTGGDVPAALAAYRCGLAGARRGCGREYAARVIRIAQGWRWYNAE